MSNWTNRLRDPITTVCDAVGRACQSDRRDSPPSDIRLFILAMGLLILLGMVVWGLLFREPGRPQGASLEHQQHVEVRVDQGRSE